MKLNNFRQIKLEDYPDYDVRLIYGRGINKKSNLDESCISKYAYFGRWYNIHDIPQMFVKGKRTINEATGAPQEGSKLKIDHSCKIPVTLLKQRYKIITSRSSQNPDFIVLGDIRHSEVSFRVFISDELKLIFCVYDYYNTSDTNYMLDMDDWHELFRNCIEDVSSKADTFRSYSVNANDAFYLMDYSKCMYDFYNKLLPDSMFVSEKKLITGTRKLTPDALISSMRMLESSDREMRDTALINLASSDYSECRNVLGYLLSKYYLNSVKSLKNKSTAVKWMTNMCDIDRCGHRGRCLQVGNESDFAKDFLLKSSCGRIYYTDEPYRTIMHCDDVNFLMRNHDFVKKIPGLSYDLSTANLVANSL